NTSYKASRPLQIVLALIGAGAFEGSIRWWARKHRAHHRYTDTVKDPYSVHKGLLYAHIGWLVMRQDPKRAGRTDTPDLDLDPVVVWQNSYFLWIAPVMALLLPISVPGVLWGDWKGGFVYAGLLRMAYIHNVTFCVNSLAHYLGEQPIDGRNSPRDHLLTAMITLGEGYHNYHHAFPSDYRNGIKWWQWDPTKWVIWTWKQLGLASELQRFDDPDIEKCRLRQQQIVLNQEKEHFDWGVPIDILPVMSWDDYQEQTSVRKKSLVAISGVVHDVGEFMEKHPGGINMIKSGIGKDATSMFKGGVYDHSGYAHDKLATLRVAGLRTR
ncbi:hypothetical protein ASPWEDRAFT_739310, partial [Aspergillus wentii DTO 134E9]